MSADDLMMSSVDVYAWFYEVIKLDSNNMLYLWTNV